MSFANPTAIKDATNGGATFSGGYVVDGGVAKYCLLTNGVWTLDENSGVLFYNRTHFNLFKNGTVETSGEYENAISTVAGLQQLALVDGFAKLIDC